MSMHAFLGLFSKYIFIYIFFFSCSNYGVKYSIVVFVEINTTRLLKECNFGIFLLQIDFLHGISLSVGWRFRQQCSSNSAWQGQLGKQDIILLTKLICTKTGSSLYNQIAEEQATVQIPPSAILKLQDQCNSGQTIDEIRKILPPGYLATKRKVIIFQLYVSFVIYFKLHVSA